MRTMKILILAAALAVLGACSSTPANPSPEQVVYKLHGDYATALTAAVAYKKLKPCDGSTPICSDPKVVSQLQRADDMAYSALSAAQKAVRQSGDPSSAANLIGSAQLAIGAFVEITTQLRR